MLTIDGSIGEGGGQVLRTSLALSMVTQIPFRLQNIRSKRAKPGLGRQHLTAVQAAARVCNGRVDGAEVGSREITFSPQICEGGVYHFSIGTAGSTSLVLQAVLPSLLLAKGPSSLVIEGGTHNPYSPPFEFLVRAYLPLVAKMGAKVQATLERPGFYPAGGGIVRFEITPAVRLQPIELHTRGRLVATSATAMIANIPHHVAEREIAVAKTAFDWQEQCFRFDHVTNSVGPGNIFYVTIESEAITEVFAAFGERGLPAEQVAEAAILEAKEYLATEVPVGARLADQLVLLLALAGGGAFRTLNPSMHTTTQFAVIEHFLGRKCLVFDEGAGAFRISM